LPIAGEVEKFAVVNKLGSLDLALYGGEEYELVVAVKSRMWKLAADAMKEAGGNLLPIGKVTAGKGVFLKTREKLVAIESRGYEHFKA
jgi:thiamine monophosphate kinase